MIIGKLFPKIVFFVTLVCMGLSTSAQTQEADSTLIADTEAEATKVHSPKRATIYSAILPGLGQAYNKKYWKIPIVYAGFGTIGYFIHWNNDNYKIMKVAYTDLTEGTGDSYLEFKPDWIDIDDPTDKENFATSISKQQAYYRRNRDLLVICMVGFYGLQIIDASVDAHMFDFDMGEDLTLNWQPNVYNMNRQTFVGVNVSFTF